MCVLWQFWYHNENTHSQWMAKYQRNQWTMYAGPQALKLHKYTHYMSHNCSDMEQSQKLSKIKDSVSVWPFSFLTFSSYLEFHSNFVMYKPHGYNLLYSTPLNLLFSKQYRMDLSCLNIGPHAILFEAKWRISLNFVPCNKWRSLRWVAAGSSTWNHHLPLSAYTVSAAHNWFSKQKTKK